MDHRCLFIVINLIWLKSGESPPATEVKMALCITRGGSQSKGNITQSISLLKVAHLLGGWGIAVDTFITADPKISLTIRLHTVHEKFGVIGSMIAKLTRVIVVGTKAIAGTQVKHCIHLNHGHDLIRTHTCTIFSSRAVKIFKCKLAIPLFHETAHSGPCRYPEGPV